MINYIGNFKDIEKEYIEKSLNMNSIVIYQDPYFPLSSLNDIFNYIDHKIADNSTLVYHFKNKKLCPTITPAIFSSKLLKNINKHNFLTSKDCIVYIGQGCSENCICTSSKKCLFSVSLNNIKQQILNLSQQNFISLYSINIGDYNYNNINIIDLCKNLLIDFPNSKLILSNISPYSSILKDLIEYIQSESRIIPILYLCINSGSQKILDIEGHRNIDNNLLYLLSKTSIKIIPYLIVGSPEETNEDFEETIKWVKKYKEFLLGSIILPYTRNGIGNDNQTIGLDELKYRLSRLVSIIENNSINYNNTNIPLSVLKNIVQIAICGEDHKRYQL